MTTVWRKVIYDAMFFPQAVESATKIYDSKPFGKLSSTAEHSGQVSDTTW